MTGLNPYISMYREWVATPTSPIWMFKNKVRTDPYVSFHLKYFHAQKNIPIHQKQSVCGCPIGITNFYCAFLLCIIDVVSTMCMIIFNSSHNKSLLEEKGRPL